MKKTLLLLSLIFGILSTIHSQVTSVDYQIKYNDSLCEYDAYIIINAGTATTIPQRIQFNAQYSIIVPTGTALTVTESYMPLQSNATYMGTTPLTWSAGTPILAPAAQPESDFYSITPDLGITSHYNNLAAGDTIKIFSIAVDTIFDCAEGIRIYENGVDPDSSDPGMGMADFSNGFLLGSINQIYSANSTQIYPSEPEVISITNACSNGVEIDLTAETSTCQGPMTYAWTGPDGYASTTEDVNISPALPENNGIYEVIITDAYGCKDSISIDATTKPNAGPDFTVCAGSTTTIYGTSPTTGTWAQAGGNPFGASLSPLAGGVTEVTISSFGSGIYEMVYSIPGCYDTMQFTVNPAPLVNVAASEICENATTVASSNIPGGTWVSNSPSVATIDANTGVVTGQSSGVTTFTYTAPTGCTVETSSLTVNPGPIVTVTGSSTICIGGFTFVTPTSGGTWSGSDPSIATVTNAGVVEGISPGTVFFNFTDTFTGCSSDGLEITVTALPEAIFTGSDSICVNGTTSLTPATGGTWVSSNPIVGTVDNGGNVVGHSVGTATFTYTNLSTGCSSLPSDTLWVLESPTVAFTGDDRLCIGETSSVSPNTGGTWASNNPSVATIDANTGIITAVAQGAVTLKFTETTTGCMATTSGLIVDPVPSVSTGFDSICITSTTLINPSSGGTWEALNSSIASLVGNTVTGVASGDAGFLFTSDATGCVSDTLFINVDAGPTTMLTGPNQICVGSTTTIEPSTGGTWSSADNTIATIDNFGLITGVGPGITTFTYTSAATLCASEPSDPVQVTSAPIVNAPSLNLCPNETMNLTPGFGGTWSSSDFSVATVNAFTGLVTAIGAGNTVFTFTDAATGCSASTDVVTVNATPFVEFTAPDTICVGFTTAISPTSGGTWVSNAPGIATIDNLGNVIGISAGNADLTYTDTNTGCSSASLTVTVLAATPVSISGEDELCIGEFSAVAPTTGGVWVSNDPSVAVITNAGVVEAVGPGQATFSFTSGAGQCTSETDPITVNGSNTIVLDKTELCIGETANATTTALGTWVSSAPAVATIDANTGVITAVAAGKTTFIFTNTTTTCVSNESVELMVFPIPSVSITGSDEICVGETTQLFPSSGGIWTCSDPSIVSINNSGLATGIAAGGSVTCTWTDNITGCTSNPSDPIFVNPSPTTTVNDDELCIGETTQLLPSSGGTWVSADPAILTVTSGGLAQGVGAGVTNLIYTSSTTGCSSEPSDPITVNGVISTVITGDSEICIGGTSQMSPSTGGTWTSSDPSVLTITNTGFVTGITTGSATFTFTPTATGCPSLPSDPIEVINCLGPIIACDQIEAENIYCDYDELGLVVGTLSESNFEGNQPSGVLCDDGDAVQNISWFGFVALEGDYEIIVNTTNCNLNIATYFGAEVGVYSDCSFSEESRVYCEKGTEIENQARIASNLLTPGQTYFLYIDGYGGSVCDYSIDVEGFYDNTYCTDLSKVTGVAYIDINENGVYDADETLLRNALISLFPGNFSVLTNEEGKYIINTPKGGATLTAKMNEGHWINNELTIEDLTVFETCVEGIDFGFVPNLFYQEAKVSVANSITRCDWETKFYFTVENTGATELETKFEFEFDDKTSYFSTNHIGLQVNGNVASGNLGTMAPFEVREFWITLKMPSGSTVLPILDFKTTLYNIDDVEMDEYEQSEQLRCSYDPNDKREYPNREGEENLTLMDEDLEYTIRFQNNGNDTAFQVKIIDPLDPNIDPTSIRVINSSHAVETCIENENLIFIFENINLVDSMTNYDGSQGFVSFRCNSKEDRLDNTIVHNTADIIFDTNAPIVTNTTINTLVNELCTYVTTEIDVEICEGDNYHGYEESGVYSEIFPLAFGCDSTVIINLDVQGITYSSQNIDICEGEPININGEEYILYESAELRDTIENGQGCISNVFIFNIEVNPNLMIEIDTMICEGLEYNGLSETGVYTIESFDEITGCEIITTIDLEVLPMSDPSCIVGIDDLESSDIKIYPIPARDVFFLEGDAVINAVSIYTMNYQKVKEFSFDVGLQKIQLSIDNMSQGLYIVAIESEGKIIYKKLIVE